MGSGVFGGGVIFVVAALLWAAVLVPTWMRRREFKSAEQNALRLQRTLRVLAETAEVPTEVRLEATAREALAQERILRTAQRQQEAERKAQLAEARAAQVRAEMRAQQMKRKQAALVRSAKLRRPWVRRMRSFAALTVLLSVIAGLVGVGLAIAGLGPNFMFGSVAALVASLGALVLLAPGRVKLVEIEAEAVTPQVASQPRLSAEVAPKVDHAALAHAAAQAAAAARIDRARALARARAGRPADLQNQPQSMLLQRAASPHAADEASPLAPGRATSHAGAAAADAAAAAVARSADAISSEAASSNADAADAAHATSAQAAPQPHAQPSQTAARLRRMGVVGDTTEGMLNLDEVLRARRRAG